MTFKITHAQGWPRALSGEEVKALQDEFASSSPVVVELTDDGYVERQVTDEELEFLRDNSWEDLLKDNPNLVEFYPMLEDRDDG